MSDSSNTRAVLLDSQFRKTYHRRNGKFTADTLETSVVKGARYFKTGRHKTDARGSLFEYRAQLADAYEFHVKVGTSVERCEYIYTFAPAKVDDARCVLVSEESIAGEQ